MVLTLAGNMVSGILQLGLGAGKVATSGPVVMAIKMYLKICIISSIFITLFMFGGIVTPLIGIIYIYYVFYKKMKCWSKNIPDSECNIF